MGVVLCRCPARVWDRNHSRRQHGRAAAGYQLGRIPVRAFRLRSERPQPLPGRDGHQLAVGRQSYRASPRQEPIEKIGRCGKRGAKLRT